MQERNEPSTTKEPGQGMVETAIIVSLVLVVVVAVLLLLGPLVVQELSHLIGRG